MKDTNIKIGNLYDIKVGKNTTPVRITKLAAKGGWEAVTLSGNKTIVIKSAERILGPHNPKPDPKPATAAQRKKPHAAAGQATTPDTVEPAAQGADPKRLSALDAAAKVLAEAKQPLNCKQMIEAMMAQGYWQPAQGGKTPANTLHAALGAEIKKKGGAARFEKVGRGQFGLRSQ
jgi:hypothetical protein